jgi:hypothetical protein
VVRVGPESAVSAWPEAPSAAPVEWRAGVHFGAEVFAVAGLFDNDAARKFDKLIKDDPVGIQSKVSLDA